MFDANWVAAATAAIYKAFRARIALVTKTMENIPMMINVSESAFTAALTVRGRGRVTPRFFIIFL